MLDDLALFISIVEAGSLNAAAQKEGLPGATVTRRLQNLEQELGYRLITRSARRMQPTAEGWQYYEQCRPLVHALRQATQQLEATLGSVTGHIRVLAPINLASGPLTPAWASFMQKYPDITLELEVSNTIQDLVGSGADLAIRVGPQQDSSLTQRLIGMTELVLVASPGYLRQAGIPQNAEDLNRHALIVAEPMRQWRLRDPQNKNEVVISALPRFRVNEMRLAIAMAEAGFGILLCPKSQCCEAFQAGTLERVLGDWLGDVRHIYAVWPQQRYLPARVRALLEHLVQFAATSPLLSQ